MEMTQAEWNDLLNQLPQKEREAVLARFFHGKTMATVSDVLGVQPHRAQLLCKRALNRLRKLIEDDPKIPFSRAALAQKDQGWFIDRSNADAADKYREFKKRMRRQLRIEVASTWPRTITYWGPLTIRLENGKTIEGIASIEATGRQA